MTTPAPVKIIDADEKENINFQKVPCPNQFKGCTEEVQKKDMEQHEKDCFFNGKHVQLCTRLGYNCTHWINALNNDSITDHFQKHHNAAVVNDNCVSVHIMNFSNTTKNFKCDGLWTPILINTTNGLQFIIQVVFHYKDKSVSWVSFQLNHEESSKERYEIEVLLGCQFSKPHPYAWKMIPVPLWKSKFADYNIMELGIQRIPVGILAENYLETIAATGQGKGNEYVLPVCFHVGRLASLGTPPTPISEVIPVFKRREQVVRSNCLERLCCPQKTTANPFISTRGLVLLALLVATYVVAFSAIFVFKEKLVKQPVLQ